MMTSLAVDISDWPTAGYPGVRINPETLLPEIVNEQACREALAESNDASDQILVLLLEGRTSDAAELLAEARYCDPESFRLRLFEAEVHRATNRFDRSIELFRQLLNQVQGSDNEAVVHQHLGRTHYAAGNMAAAVESFSKALDLRVAASADASLIYSSTLALQRARDVLDLAS